ncbi:MAG: hypothetical protein HQK50_14785, partial [Oligoflexia bacterium]|nr:hypothetical protein [Oligoflexia bacterium]
MDNSKKKIESVINFLKSIKEKIFRRRSPADSGSGSDGGQSLEDLEKDHEITESKEFSATGVTTPRKIATDVADSEGADLTGEFSLTRKMVLPDQTRPGIQSTKIITSAEKKEAPTLVLAEVPWSKRPKVLWQFVKERLLFHLRQAQDTRELGHGSIMDRLLNILPFLSRIISQEMAKIAPPLRRFGRNIFSVPYRGIVHKLFIVSVVVTTFYSLGKIFALMLGGGAIDRPIPFGGILISPPPEESFSSGIELVKMSNLFHAKLMSEEEQKKVAIDDNVICTEATAASSLPVKLLNTIVLQNTIKSIAAFQVESEQEIKSLREGDKITGLISIGRVDRLRVVVKNLQTGQCEYIANKEMSVRIGKELDILSPQEGSRLLRSQKMQGIHNDGDKFFISRKILLEKFSDISATLTQAKANPMPNPDGTMSFKGTDIVP